MAIGRRIIETIIRAKDETKKGFASAENRLTRFGNAVKQFGSLRIAAIAGAGVAGLERLTAAFDRVGKAAQRLGITSEELSKLQFAAKLAGVDADVLNQALFRLQRVAGDAAAGVGEAAKTFDRLGIVADDFVQLPFAEQVRQISNALGNIENQSERASLAAKLFDEQWRQVLELLSDSEGIKDAGENLEALGGVMTDVATNEAAFIQDELAKAFEQIKGFGVTLLELNAKLRALEFGAGDVVNPDLSKSVTKITKKIVALTNKIEELKAKGDEGPFILRLFRKETIIAEIAELKRLIKERDDLLAGEEESERLREREKAEQDHNKEMTAARDAQTKALAQTIKDRQALLAANLTEAERYAEGQRRLIEDINEALASFSGGGSTEYIDVLNKISEAWGQLGTGDFSGALETIDSGLEVLKNYESTGEDSASSIDLLTSRFEELAKAASKGSEKEFTAGIEGAKAEAEAFKKEVESKPANMVVLPDPASGKIIHDQAQKQIDNVGAVSIKVIGVFGGFEGGARASEQDPNDTVTVTELSEKRGFRL